MQVIIQVIILILCIVGFFLYEFILDIAYLKKCNREREIELDYKHKKENKKLNHEDVDKHDSDSDVKNNN